MTQTSLLNAEVPLARTRPGLVAQILRSLGMRVSAAGLTFALVPVCLQAMGMKAFGEYAIAISWMNLLVVVAKLGFDTASLRYVAQYRAQGEQGLLRGFVVTSRQFTNIASLLLALGLAGGTLLLQERMTGGLFWSLLFAACLLPFMANIQLREASLLACGHIMAGQMGGMLLPLLLIVLLSGGVLFTGAGLSSSVAVLLNLVSGLITLGVMRVLSGRVLGRSDGEQSSDVRVDEWVSVASPLLLVQLLFLLQNQSGTILCGWLINEEAAGLFFALSRVASVLLLGLQAIGMIAAPQIAALYHSGRTIELGRYIRRCALASFGFAATFALLMLIGGRSVLGLLGEEVAGGYLPMVVLLGGLALAAVAGPVNQLMMMTGRQWDCIKVYGAIMAFSLILGLVIIPAHGVLGAAITAAFARIGSSVGLVLYARQRHGLWCIVGPVPISREPVPVPPRVAA